MYTRSLSGVPLAVPPFFGGTDNATQIVLDTRPDKRGYHGVRSYREKKEAEQLPFERGRTTPF